MKKVIAGYLCVIVLLLCGCATQNNTDDSSNKNLSLNPTGTYTDVSFSDTNSLYLDFKLQAAEKENKKETFVITGTDGDYSYQDSVFSGRFVNNGDGDFTARKEQVITNNTLLLNTAKLELEQIGRAHV